MCSRQDLNPGPPILTVLVTAIESQQINITMTVIYFKQSVLSLLSLEVQIKQEEFPLVDSDGWVCTLLQNETKLK